MACEIGNGVVVSQVRRSIAAEHSLCYIASSPRRPWPGEFQELKWTVLRASRPPTSFVAFPLPHQKPAPELD